LFNVLTKF